MHTIELYIMQDYGLATECFLLLSLYMKL